MKALQVFIKPFEVPQKASLLLTWRAYFTPCSTVSVVDFEQRKYRLGKD